MICIDFRDLNRATPKDEYPMPIAESLIDAAAGHKMMSFLDGNAGYNQIFMAEEDVYKTAFCCPQGLFEFVVMTFSLRNTGATYQRAMNFIFHDLIGRLVEVYIDDMVVKSVQQENHLADLRQVHERTRKHGMRMNPDKCAFGVTAGQFLGFMIHECGIETGSKSKDTIKMMVPPACKKELQELIGKINYIRRFIPNLSAKLEAFMPLVRAPKSDEFVWGPDQQLAFDNLKRYLTAPQMMAPPRLDLPFIVYLSANEVSIGSVLIQEVDAKSASTTTLAEAYSMRRPGTLKWIVYVYVYILHAQNFIITCSMPRRWSSTKPTSLNICCQHRSSKGGLASGCFLCQNLTLSTDWRKLSRERR